MDFFGYLKQVGETLFASHVEMRHVKEDQARDRDRTEKIANNVEHTLEELNALRERVVRLEEARANDKREMQLERERFQLFVERATIRAQNPGVLPPLIADADTAP